MSITIKKTREGFTLVELSTVIVLLIFIAISTSARAETITISADPWCPYTCDSESEQQGFMIDLVKKAFKKHGIEVKYVIESWARAITETREGRLHAIVGASKGDAPDFVFPKVAQGKMENAFYVKNESTWSYSDPKSLDKICIGAITDYSYSDIFNTYAERHKNDPARIQYASGDNPLDINVKKLLAGRIDAVVETTLVMKYYLNMHNITGIKEAGKTQSSEQDLLYIAFSPKDPNSSKYAKIITDETLAMRANGELKTLLNTYQIDDWENKAKLGK